MIRFQWELLSDHRFRINVVTPRSVVGTLHRLTAAMYVLGMDIVSGNVLTEELDGITQSNDTFILQTSDQSDPHISVNESTARLGELMETVLSPTSDLAELLSKYKVKAPDSAVLFAEAHQIHFVSETPDRMSRLYVQAPDRRGLLFHITQVIARMEINIVQAVILSTDGGLAEDTIDLQFQDAPLTNVHCEQLIQNLESS